MKLTTAINRVGLSGSNNCCCFMFYIIHNYEQNGIGNILQKFISFLCDITNYCNSLTTFLQDVRVISCLSEYGYPAYKICKILVNRIFTPCSNDSIKSTLILYNFVKPDFSEVIY